MKGFLRLLHNEIRKRNSKMKGFDHRLVPNEELRCKMDVRNI